MLLGPARQRHFISASRISFKEKGISPCAIQGDNECFFILPRILARFARLLRSDSRVRRKIMFNSILRMLAPSDVVFKAYEVFPGLFQGSKISSDDDVDIIKSLKIQNIIDLEGGFDPPMSFLDSYLFWPILDLPILPDLGELLITASFGKSILDHHRRLLVHCRCGLNRSGLVCGKIMSLKGCRGPEILSKISEKVPGALWNPVFREYVRGL